MIQRYMAKLYQGKEEIMNISGDDMDELYTLMLSRAQDQLGNIHGEIIEVATQKIVKQFRKAPPD